MVANCIFSLALFAVTFKSCTCVVHAELGLFTVNRPSDLTPSSRFCGSQQSTLDSKGVDILCLSENTVLCSPHSLVISINDGFWLHQDKRSW